MNALSVFVASFQEYLWSFPMLVALLGTHLMFTVRLRFIQKRIPEGIRLSFSGKSEGNGNISPYSALATALAATIGTGNIIGISTAIAVGGPGAVFWCWLTGVFGIATCYAECFLSVKFRVKKADGTYQGGPMYVLENGLRKKGLAMAFAVFTVLASFGMGSSVQAHSISSAVTGQFQISPHLVGMAAGVLAGVIMMGGGRQIAKVCTYLVPVMSIFYLGGCLFVILANHAFLKEAIAVIVKAAFSSKSVIGGIAGTAVMTGIRTGISRGLFTNEAGMGSIPMAAASAQTVSPVRQGIISMTGTFWDTVIMCAITGIAIVSSMVKDPGAFVGVAPDQLCFVTFSGLPLCGGEMLSLSLVLFAFATIIGWNYYGECAVRYLFGEKGIKAYQFLYMMAVYLGAVMSLELVWGISDLFNSFMAIPNIISLWLLQKIIVKETCKENGSQ